MNSRFIAVLAAGLFCGSPAFGVTIDFETPTSFASIDRHYAGGTDSAGVAGTDLGVSFGADALGLKNDELGPYFSNAPSPLGIMAPVGADAAMNLARGFRGLATFLYSSTEAATVRVWSGVNGQGVELGAFALENNATTGCNDSPYCNWSLASFDVGGLARSITFGDAAFLAGFDDVTVDAVPGPAGVLVFSLGMVMLGFTARQRRAA